LFSFRPIVPVNDCHLRKELNCTADKLDKFHKRGTLLSATITSSPFWGRLAAPDRNQLLELFTSLGEEFAVVCVCVTVAPPAPATVIVNGVPGVTAVHVIAVPELVNVSSLNSGITAFAAFKAVVQFVAAVVVVSPATTVYVTLFVLIVAVNVPPTPAAVTVKVSTCAVV
jgi:hypothetical protein